MSFLFKHGPEDYRRPATKATSRPRQHTAKIDAADTAVVSVFMALQNVWRHQGTLRRTFNGMPASREERQAWRQLIQYLAKLPPPQS